jgi:hypothetical protein
MVGRYVIEGRLGAGGGGTVYRARDPETGRVVAVKLLVSDGRAASPRARLLREAQSLAKLQHENIVEFYEVGVFNPGVLDPSASATDNGVFLAMEFVDGSNLAQWADDPHSWQQVRDVFVAAGRGLAFAHARGIVHRDFKPSNVLVGDDGRVRVADFGLARATRELTAPLPGLALRLPDEASLPGVHMALTKPGTVIGTPAYMAPEQHLSSRADARSDQFSFCLALYEALYRRSPYQGSTPGKLLEAKLRGIIVPPPRDTVIPSRVNRAVVRGLAPDPAARHESMEALLDALVADAGAPRPARVVLAVAIAGVSIAIVGATAWTLGRAPAASCDDTLATSSWDHDRELQLRESFAAKGVAYGETTLVRVRDRFDRWSTDWSTARGAICATTTASSPAIACLRASKLAATAVQAAVSRADALHVERAIRASARLPGAARCSATTGGTTHDRSLDERLWQAFAALELGESGAAGQADALRSDAGTGAPAIAAAATILLAEASPTDVDDAALARAHAAVTDLATPMWSERAALLGLARTLDVGDAEAAARWIAALDPHRAAPEVLARVEVANATLALGRGSTAQAVHHCNAARDAVAAAAVDAVIAFDIEVACARIIDADGPGPAAIAQWESAAAVAERAFGSDHPIAARTRCDLGLALLAAGRRDPARPHAALGFDVLRRVTAPDDVRRLLPLVLLFELEPSRDSEAGRRWLSFAETVVGEDPSRRRAYALALLDVATAVGHQDAARGRALLELASTEAKRSGDATLVDRVAQRLTPPA